MTRRGRRTEENGAVQSCEQRVGRFEAKWKGAKREDAVGVAQEKEKIRWGVKRQEDV